MRRLIPPPYIAGRYYLFNSYLSFSSNSFEKVKKHSITKIVHNVAWIKSSITKREDFHDLPPLLF
jgi:DNA relaxase NicK